MTDAVQATPQEDAESRMGVGLHKAAARAQEIAQETRVPEFLLGIVLLFDRHEVGRFPLEAPLLAFLIVVSLLIRPKVRVRGEFAIVASYLLMLAYVVGLSVGHGLPWMQRGLRWFMLFWFAMILAEGRFNWKSIVAGFSFSLVFLNIPFNFTALRSADYEGFLTGVVGDKNVAGLWYSIAGLTALSLFRSVFTRTSAALVFGAAVYFTGSRTSMSAFAVGIVWVLIRNRTDLWVRTAGIGGLVWMLTYVEGHYARIGVFADRTGTDWFRSMIDAATREKLATTPWYGSGLNTAWVDVYTDRSIWFHDSYAALRVEGGWPLFAFILILFIILGAGVFNSKTVSWDATCLEGAIAVVLVCAWKLGEVFFTVPSFLVLGAALREHLGGPLSATSAEVHRWSWQSAAVPLNAAGEVGSPQGDSISSISRGGVTHFPDASVSKGW